MTRVIALDPGRSKCGLLLADIATNTVVQGMVIPSAEVLDQLRSWMVDAQGEDAQIAELVIGDGVRNRRPPASVKLAELSRVEHGSAGCELEPGDHRIVVGERLAVVTGE